MKRFLTLLSIFALYSCMECPAQSTTHTRAHAMGYVPDKGWTKGVLAFEVSPFRATPVLPAPDLTALMIPDDNQGQVGCCTGFGLCRAVSAGLKKEGAAAFTIFSQDFVYYNERVIMGTVNQDSGAMIGTDGIACLKAQGACLLSTWPLKATLNTTKPGTVAYAEGQQHLVLHAYKVINRTGQDFERALSAGFVVVYGITLRSEFEQLDGTHYVYHGKGPIIGGHCMVAYQYNLGKTTTSTGLAPGMVRTHNQWGDDWGNHDTFDMPLTIIHSSAVDDCYVIDVVAVPGVK